MIPAAIIGFFDVACIVAIVNGQYLWLTIPLAMLAPIAFMVILSSWRRTITPRGLIVDSDGIHTTLKGARTRSFSWEIIDAAGMSYVTRAGGEFARRKHPGSHHLDLFCSTEQYDTPLRNNKIGHPIRVDDGGSSSYGVPGGHLQIGLGEPSASKRQEIKDSIASYGSCVIIDDFERPRFPGDSIIATTEPKAMSAR